MKIQVVVAEDGIRDHCVTGVQTCALPIFTNQWNQWVLGYNPDRQREMLSWLGVPQPSWQTMTVMLFWSVAGVLLLTALWLLRGIRREDPVQDRKSVV